MVVTRTRPSNRALITLAMAFLLLLCYFVLRKATLGYFIGGYGIERHVSIMHYSTVTNLAHYAIRTFFPVLPLKFGRIDSPIVFLGAGFLLICVTVGMFLRFKIYNTKRWYLLALLLLCYMLSLVPVATMRIGIFNTQSERFLYLPSAFACLGAVAVLEFILRRRHVKYAVLASVVLIEALTLQWVNSRWITASILSERIAAEVSSYDPDKTVILNVPDNYRGAYVFRNGLHEAATLFVGNEVRGRYRVICAHSLDSLQQRFDVHVTESNIVLTLPGALQFHAIHAGPYDVRREGRSLILSEDSTEEEKHNEVRFLSFKSGVDRPMLRTIEWSP